MKAQNAIALEIEGGSAWDTEPWRKIQVSWEELEKAQVGDEWYVGSLVRRATLRTRATVVYKDERGVLVRVIKEWYPNTPEPSEPVVRCELLYFSFRPFCQCYVEMRCRE